MNHLGSARFSPFEDLWRRVVRAVILGMLKPWTADDVRFAVEHNVMLATLARADADHLAGVGKLRKAAQAIPKWESLFSAAFVLDWLRENRHDLIPIMTTPEGEAWLARNVEALKTLAWGEQEPQPLTQDELRDVEALVGEYAKVVPDAL